MDDNDPQSARQATQHKQLKDVADSLAHARDVIAASRREVERSQHLRRDVSPQPPMEKENDCRFG